MIKYKKIQKFTLIYDGLFWVQHKETKYPISITPPELALLFEQEGLNMKQPRDIDAFKVTYYFRKAVLLLSRIHSVELHDEGGNVIRPFHCTVQLMQPSDIVIGLDLGTSKIAATVGHRNEFGEMQIIGYWSTKSKGITRGIISNIEVTAQSIREVLSEAESFTKIKIHAVNAGISGQHIRTIQHKELVIRDCQERRITRRELDQMKENMFNLTVNPCEIIFDVIPVDYTIDHEINTKHPHGMIGHTLEANFHIITGLNTAILNVIRCIEKAGYKVDNLSLNHVAAARAVLTREEKETGVVLVDIGGGTTEVAIFLEGCLRYVAVVPFGGNVITEDIKEIYGNSWQCADDLKIKFGTAQSSNNRNIKTEELKVVGNGALIEITPQNLTGIIQNRMREILEYVSSEIVNSGLSKQLPGKLVVTGGGALLPDLEQFIKLKTGMDARVGHPTEYLERHSVQNYSSPLFSVGVGLIMTGLPFN